MFKEARKSYDSDGFLLQYKEVAKKFDKYCPKLLCNMLRMDIQEHSIGPVRFYCYHNNKVLIEYLYYVQPFLQYS